MSKNCTCQQYAVLVPIKTVASKGCKVSIATVVHKRYPVIKESNAISHKTNLLAVQYMSWQTFAPMITTDPSLYMLKKTSHNWPLDVRTIKQHIHTINCEWMHEITTHNIHVSALAHRKHASKANWHRSSSRQVSINSELKEITSLLCCQSLRELVHEPLDVETKLMTNGKIVLTAVPWKQV